jgi:serine/threonine protein kinase
MGISKGFVHCPLDSFIPFSDLTIKINVLVEEFGRALLCDFGLARIKADITSRTRAMSDTVVSGSRNWMAPELLSGSLPRTPSDIYAFGMTLYEVRICPLFLFLGDSQ